MTTFAMGVVCGVACTWIGYLCACLRNYSRIRRRRVAEIGCRNSPAIVRMDKLHAEYRRKFGG